MHTREIAIHQVFRYSLEPEETVATIRNPQISKDGKRIPLNTALEYIEKHRLGFAGVQNVFFVKVWRYNNATARDAQNMFSELINMGRQI